MGPVIMATKKNEYTYIFFKSEINTPNMRHQHKLINFTHIHNDF
jgi:hypothetical protein